MKRPSVLVAMMLMATSTACSPSDEAAADGGETTGGGSDNGGETVPGTSTGSGGSDPTNAASTADEGDSADSSGSDAGESDDGTGGPEALGPCEDFDCGAGSCTVDRAGRATCLCPEPLVGAGLECFSCTAVADTYDVDVQATNITIELTLAGNPAPASANESATLWLHNPATGEMIALGNTHSGPLRARVIPTGYEIIYGRITGSEIPANRRAVVGIVDAKGTSEVVVDLNLGVVRLEGEFSFDGTLAPASMTENGRVWLRNQATGDELYLGETRVQTFAAYVLPGIYDVEFESLTAGDVAPRNRRARVMTIEIPDGDLEVPVVQSIDIPTQVITGEFLVDGVPAPDTLNERAQVSLRDPVTGDEFPIGDTNNGIFEVRVVPGEYDVVYKWLAGSSVMPSNSHAIIGKLDTTVADTHDVQIDTVTVSGAFMIDGAVPPTNANDDGRLSLRNESTGDEVQLGNTTVGAFERIVVAAPYTIHYAQDTSSSIAPANANARIDTIDVAVSDAFDIDVPTAFVSGLITIGEGAPPDSDYDDGWVYLRNAETGDTVLLANTRMGLFGVAVVPGSYEVVYEVETAGGQVPINVESVVLDIIEVAGATAFDVDIPVRGLEGAIAAGGQPGERGSVYLQAQGAVSRSLLGNTVDLAYLQPVIPGRYLVTYGVDSSTGGLPVNTNAPLACIELAGG